MSTKTIEAIKFVEPNILIGTHCEEFFAELEYATIRTGLGFVGIQISATFNGLGDTSSSTMRFDSKEGMLKEFPTIHDLLYEFGCCEDWTAASDDERLIWLQSIDPKLARIYKVKPHKPTPLVAYNANGIIFIDGEKPTFSNEDGDEDDEDNLS